MAKGEIVSGHLLEVTGMREEGWPKLAIKCPASEGERCPDNGEPNFTGCVLQWLLDEIGNEVIESNADGPGPWPVVYRYESDEEAWITLTEVSS
jgi:hypothetical protein